MPYTDDKWTIRDLIREARDKQAEMFAAIEERSDTLVGVAKNALQNALASQMVDLSALRGVVAMSAGPFQWDNPHTHVEIYALFIKKMEQRGVTVNALSKALDFNQSMKFTLTFPLLD